MSAGQIHPRSSDDHDSEHEVQILDQVARLFRAYPSGKNVDEHTLCDYCEAFAPYKLAIVSHVVDRFRLGDIQRKSHDFPPALAEIMTHIKKRDAFEMARLRHQNAGAHPHKGQVSYILPQRHYLNQIKGGPH